MWLLECDDKDALGGSRMWIRPGSRCVLGRVKYGDVTVEVSSHKSISRTHLVINVSAVNDEDGVKIHARSQVTLQDCDTKHGTKVDGLSIKGKPKVLDRLEHTFSLGKSDVVFRIKWEPVVLSFSLLGKEKKDKNAMVPYRKKVEALDIKTIATWTDATTHIVAAKRNTAIGLQALVNGRYIVNYSYLDAIATAATQPPPEGNVTPLSPLEVDFDANWPNAVDYLPPKGREPTDWPPEKFLPDPKRNNMFEGWTFVFCDDAQYGTLLAPITDAGGKADKFTLEHKKTIAPDIAQFVQKKGRAEDVAVVSFHNTYKNDLQWAEDLCAETEELLGFQMVQQNTFLDLMVTGDKSGLRKPLDAERSSGRMQAATQAAESAVIPETAQDIIKGAMQPPTVPIKEATVELESSALESTTRGRRARTRRLALPPGGFSFDLGGDFLPAPTPTPAPETQFPSASIPTPSSEIMMVDEIGGETTMGFTQMEGISEESGIPPSSEPPAGPSQSQYCTSATSPRKRPALEPVEEEEYKSQDVMDLLPGSRIIKRRKLAEEKELLRRGETEAAAPRPATPEPMKVEVKAEPPPTVRKGRSKKPPATTTAPTPFSKAAATLRGEQSAASQQARDDAALDPDEDITALRNLAIVEFVPLKPRSDKLSRSGPADESRRWRDEWNGRKNFKGFRRNGRGGAMRSAAGKVIIGVVEHRGRDYGIGDGYWVDDHAKNSNNNSNQSASARTAATATTTAATPASRRSQVTVVVARERSEDSTAREESAPVSERERRSVSVAGTKRRVREGAAAQRGKRQRTLQIRGEESDDSDGGGGGQESDSEDDDGLKFRFRRR